jgi:hypothetical protein
MVTESSYLNGTADRASATLTDDENCGNPQTAVHKIFLAEWLTTRDIVAKACFFCSLPDYS